METINIPTPDINEIVKIYADKKGLSDMAAWAAIRGVLTPRNEILNILETQNKTGSGSQQQPNSIRTSELYAQGVAGKNEQLIEKMRQDYDIKKSELEQKKEEREERRREFEEKKLTAEKELALARLAFDKEVLAQRIEQENKDRRLKEELETKRLLQKDDFDQKLLLIQAEATKIQQTQAAQLAQQQQTAALALNSRSPEGDVFDQISKVQAIEKTFNDTMIHRLEAIGVDASTLKKLAGGTPKSGGVQWDKVFELVVPLIEKVIKPDPAQLNAPSGLEQTGTQAPPKNPISPEIEARIRKETEAKAQEIALQNAQNMQLQQKLTTENTQLQQQLEEEKKRIQSLLEERMKLESRANELGITYNDTVTNDQLFDWIEQIESANEQQQRMAQRVADRESQELARLEAMPKEVAVIQEIQEGDVQVNGTEVPASGNVYAINQIETEPPSIQVQDIPAQEINLVVDPIEIELAKPRESSEETQEFMEEVAGKPEPEEPVKAEVTQKTTRKAKKGDKHKFNVYNSDGSLIAEEVVSASHRNAGLKVANGLNGTKDNPVRIKVTELGTQETKEYDAFSTEAENRAGSKYKVPRITNI